MAEAEREAPAESAADAPRPRRAPRGRLVRKYAAFFIAVVSVALLANGAFEIWLSYKDHEASLVGIEREEAQSAAGKIEQFVAEIESQIGWTTELPWSAATLDQRRFDALRLLRQVPAITELSQLDAQGKEQLRVSRLEMDVVGSGTDYSHDPRFTEAMAKKVWFGPVYFRRESEPYMTLALAGARRDAGVSVAEVNLKFIWDVVSQIKIGKHGIAYVVDGDGRLIAHPDISLVLRNTSLARLPQVAAALRGARQETLREAADPSGKSVLTAWAKIAPMGWYVFVELPTDEANAPLYASIERASALLAGCLLLAFLAALFLARRMVVPIEALRAGAARIGGGDLAQRLSLKTGDELESLADQFNDMAGRLQESYAGLERKVEERTQELSESLDRQTAMADVLRVISSSPGSLEPVFEAMLGNAVRLCDAAGGLLLLRDGDVFRAMAVLGMTASFAGAHGPGTTTRNVLERSDRPIGRVFRSRETLHIPDLSQDTDAASGDRVRAVVAEGVRTALYVPMLKDTEVLGIFALGRKAVSPFADKQIELVENFAAQAVIAIENARLLTELRESLDRQTATAEVLGVISASPGDVAPVFDTILDNALRLCEAETGNIYRLVPGGMRIESVRGALPEFEAFLRRQSVIPIAPNLAHVIKRKEPLLMDDVREGPGYRARQLGSVAAVDLGGIRASLIAPLVRDDAVIGLIVIYRREVRPFTQKHVDLVTNFAAQAVIAIENARLLTELRESLDRQTATSEVLGVIASSPGQTEPVFDTILENALRLCETETGHIARVDGDGGHVVALRGAPAEFAEFVRTYVVPLAPDGSSGARGAVAQKRSNQVADLREHEAYRARAPMAVAAVETAGVRTVLYVPMLRGEDVTGLITIYRREVRPFTDKHVELVENFAKQAVIAIENARLLSELREALDQQTATAEVLQVINASPGDLAPVFDAVLDKGLTLCRAAFGLLHTYDGERFRTLAMRGIPDDMAEQLREWVPDPGSALMQLVQGARVVHIPDVVDTEAYRARVGTRVLLVEVLGGRTALWVALRREDALLGAFVIYRKEVRPFSDKEIALLENFAAQAVIAMENARLINETREALDRQTATSEVLGVISSSPGDLKPVFDTMLENATRICEAQTGLLHRYDGEVMELMAARGVTPEYAKHLRRLQPLPHFSYGRMIRTKAFVHVPDMAAEPEYLERTNPAALASVDIHGARTCLFVPLRKEDLLVGSFVLHRKEVRPFTVKQIELVENFAAQAVIAIENARLLTELRESLDRQTATAEVLSVISSSPGELEPVFRAMLVNATRICESDTGIIYRYEDNAFRTMAMHGVTPAFREFLDRGPLRPGPTTAFALIVREKRTVHVADTMDVPSYHTGEEAPRAGVALGGIRTSLFVPMLKEGELIGIIQVFRREVRPFTEKQIALVENFADQAVIAIENARLLTELRESLDRQTATADILRVIASTPGDPTRALDTIAETAVRMFDASSVGIRRTEGSVLRYIAAAGPYSRALREAIPEIPLDLTSSGGQCVVENRQIAVADIQDGNSIVERWNLKLPPEGRTRTSAFTPLTREGEAIGMMAVNRGEVRPFTPNELELMRGFADQAVIAIENARLLTELRESLDRQTATAEILRVIASTPGDPTRALDTIAETAARMFGASNVAIRRRDGNVLRHVSIAGSISRAIAAEARELPMSESGGFSVCVRENRQINVEYADTSPYTASTPGGRMARELGLKTAVFTPLAKEGAAIGAIMVGRSDPRPFTPDELQLMRGFADQAVIAIENARLLSELRARTDELARSVEELRALGEVSQAVNSSLDLQTVLTTIVTNSVRLSATDAGAIYVYDAARDEFALRATFGMDERLIAAIRSQHITFGAAGVGEAAQTRMPVQIPDLAAGGRNPITEIIVEAGFRALLVMPLLRPDRVVGALVVRRRAPGEFPASTVDLLQTFAAQSVAAIENARLFGEIEEKSRELVIASQHKSQFLANMSHELRTPLNAILGYTELILDDIYGAAPQKMREVLARVQTNGRHLLGLINDVLDLSKIEAGQLTLQLAPYSVKDMLQSVYVAVEPLASAKKIALTLDLPKDLPAAKGDERRLAQVVLNLVGNAIKFTDDGEVTIAARAGKGGILVSVRDTGPGIAESDQQKIFEEFQQADNSSTRAKGGTGLGLAISRRIVALHGGRLWVESAMGKGSTFSFTLPVTVERQVENA